VWACVTGKWQGRWLGALVGVAALAIAGFFALPWVLIAPAELTHSDVILHLATALMLVMRVGR